MALNDWTALANRGGQSFEDFVAACLRARYTAAVQSNPSQGDGGVDISMWTDAGLVVWQVKKFASPLSKAQWRQVSSSWNRFWTTQVQSGKPVAAYYLVTPWGPTPERVADFEVLTAAADFPTQWDSGAFLDVLAADFPGIFERYVYGPKALEAFVRDKASLASSPIELGDPGPMLHSISIREGAVDQIRDLVSDNYVINYGTRTLADGHKFPLPAGDDAAVMHRFESLGGNRWSYQSVVPRNPESFEAEPIELNIEFLVEEGSEDAQKVLGWKQWGIPFTEVPARMKQTGGPFANEEPVDAHLSFVSAFPSRSYPQITFLAKDRFGTPRSPLILDVSEATTGVDTGWLRIVAKSPGGMLTLEMRIAGDVRSPESTAAMRFESLDGRSPTQTLADAELLKAIEETDVLGVLLSDNLVLAATGFSPPAEFEYAVEVAEGLKLLQTKTSSRLLMPEILAIGAGQLEILRRHVRVYRGEPIVETWEEEVGKVEDIVAFTVAFQASHPTSFVVSPTLTLGERVYEIDHPTVDTRSSVRLPDDVDVSQLQNGDSVRIVPGDDPTRTIAKLVDWKPGMPLGRKIGQPTD